MVSILNFKDSGLISGLVVFGMTAALILSQLDGIRDRCYRDPMQRFDCTQIHQRVYSKLAMFIATNIPNALHTLATWSFHRDLVALQVTKQQKKE
jgi:hypothetical protein